MQGSEAELLNTDEADYEDPDYEDVGENEIEIDEESAQED